MELDPTRCYAALRTRDARFDGRFFTGVKTTGVYCRPICPARTPLQKNIRFFACAAAAEAAGFRPCRRCRPETAPGTPAWTGTSAAVSRALRLIAAGEFDGADVEALAGRVGVGGRQLRRLFASHVGASPAQVARARRVHFARALLAETTLPMIEVAAAAGFQSLRQFNHAVRATFRSTPTALRGRGRGVAGRPGVTVRLPYRPPLDWQALLAFLAQRATPGVEVVDGGVYRRTIRVEGGVGTLAVRAEAAARRLVMHLDVPEHLGLLAIVTRVRRLFDLEADPLAIGAHLGRSDELRPLVRRRPGLRVPGAWDPFEIAVRAIVGQQVTVRGATTLMGRLVERWGEPTLAPPPLTRLFPTPEVLAEAEIERIGMPKARAQALRTVAGEVASGRLTLASGVDLESAVAQLKALPGVGAWTAQYVAMRALGEPDAFPSGDLGLRQAIANGSGPPTSRVLERRAEAWRPWRAYAAMHLWASLGEPRRARLRGARRRGVTTSRGQAARTAARVGSVASDGRCRR
jgi:AraC family transcriptional regulator of adaptative response / DNA-3-methyladenine glycosylase II